MKNNLLNAWNACIPCVSAWFKCQLCSQFQSQQALGVHALGGRGWAESLSTLLGDQQSSWLTASSSTAVTDIWRRKLVNWRFALPPPLLHCIPLSNTLQEWKKKQPLGTEQLFSSLSCLIGLGQYVSRAPQSHESMKSSHNAGLPCGWRSPSTWLGCCDNSLCSPPRENTLNKIFFYFFFYFYFFYFSHSVVVYIYSPILWLCIYI